LHQPFQAESGNRNLEGARKNVLKFGLLLVGERRKTGCKFVIVHWPFKGFYWTKGTVPRHPVSLNSAI
jgi:hypothetical protein